MAKLVIVESPSKAKTIQKYLGKGYVVKASKGHVVDLPKSGLAVDVDKNFTPEYQVTKAVVVRDLKKAFKGADEALVLAVDPDREGEAIGWHIAKQLGAIDLSGKPKKGHKVERIVFTEITKDAVQAAIDQPRDIDMDLVNAQQARRILDRLVGYKLSPLLWKKIRYGLSAGRVQSVAVKLIVDKERERQAFKPEEYWSIKALLQENAVSSVKIEVNLKSGEAVDDQETTNEEEQDDSLFHLVKIAGKKAVVPSKAAVDKIIETIKKDVWKIVDISSKTSKRNTYPPFSTSSLQQSAANILGFSSSRTMRAAQKLYEQGSITYMRTDSISMSSQAINSARSYIQKTYGKDYLPAEPVYYKTKSKVAQEAHEAIRPTDLAKKVEQLGLDGDESRLYDLIWRRAIASQMSPALVETDTVLVDIGTYTFQLTGRRVLFAGYTKLYPERITEVNLPKYIVGQQLYANKILGNQHFTQPPARYSEATLIKALEQLGIGRPSTYAPIIQTIQSRKYVEKTGKYFSPTDTGIVVTDLLSKHFKGVVDAGFTADMENNLDDVANGEKEWVKMLAEFYKGFESELNTAEKKIKKEDFTVLGEAPAETLCPECGGKMHIKLGKFGRFYSCKDFPNCKGMRSMDGVTDEELAAKPSTEEFKRTYLPAPRTDDGREYVFKRGRFGEFWAHPDYPKVKDAKPLEYQPDKLAEVYGEVPFTPEGKPYLIKRGRFGEFWAHPDYPKVKDIKKISRPKS